MEISPFWMEKMLWKKQERHILKKGSYRVWKSLNGEISILNGDFSIPNGENALEKKDRQIRKKRFETKRF